MEEINVVNQADNQLSIIRAFLDQYKWKYDAINNDTLITGFQGDNADFTMFIHCSVETLFISIPVFVESPTENCREQFHKYLLKLNFFLTLAKFSVDELDRPALTVELPMDLITYDLFIFALVTLATTADEQVLAAHEAATNPHFHLGEMEIPQKDNKEGT